MINFCTSLVKFCYIIQYFNTTTSQSSDFSHDNDTNDVYIDARSLK